MGGPQAVEPNGSEVAHHLDGGPSHHYARTASLDCWNLVPELCEKRCIGRPDSPENLNFDIDRTETPFPVCQQANEMAHVKNSTASLGTELDTSPPIHIELPTLLGGFNPDPLQSPRHYYKVGEPGSILSDSVKDSESCEPSVETALELYRPPFASGLACRSPGQGKEDNLGDSGTHDPGHNFQHDFAQRLLSAGAEPLSQRMSRSGEDLKLDNDETAHSLLLSELSVEGKSTPRPLHLGLRQVEGAGSPRPLPLNLHGNTDTRLVQERTEQSSEELQGLPKLQKSFSHTRRRFFKGPGPALAKLQATSAILGRSFSRSNVRERLAKNLSENREYHVGIISGAGQCTAGTTNKGVHSAPVRLLNDAEGIDSPKYGLLRRFLNFGGWGTSRKWMKELVKKKEKASSGTRDKMKRDDIEDQRAETESEELHDLTRKLDSETLDQEPPVSSVSNLYSESPKAQGRRRNSRKKSEIQNPQHWLTRHWKMQGRPTQEGGGNEKVIEAFHDASDTLLDEGDDKVLNGSARFSFEKLSIAKRFAKHKRNSTWDSGTLSPTRNPFALKQQQLPVRDAQELLTPPRKLSGDMVHRKRKGKLSMLNLQPESFTSTITEVSEKRTSSTNVPREPSVILATEKASATDIDATSAPGLGADAIFDHICKPTASENYQQVSHEISERIQLTSHLVDSGTLLNLTPASGELVAYIASSPNHQAMSPHGTELRKYPRSQPVNGTDLLSLDKITVTCSTTPAEEAVSVKHTEFEATQPETLAPSQLSDVTEPTIAELLTEQRKSYSSSSQDENARFSVNIMGAAASPLPLPVSPRPHTVSFEEIVIGRGRPAPTDNILLKFFFKCREIENMNKFLSVQKKRFLESSSPDVDKCFHMILSSADPGLSSMVAALCTTWLLQNTLGSTTSTKWHAIPVMNMTRKDMWQHRDAAWLFYVCGIEANAVLFFDEITPLNETVVAGRVKRAVIGQDVLVTENEVGSCCTILAEKFQLEAPAQFQARYMKTLLLAGILLDTENLSFGSQRDKEMATCLLVGAGSLGRNGLFNHLKQIRNESYVTTFIKDLYGEANPFAVSKGQGAEQSNSTKAASQNDAKNTTSVSSREGSTPTGVEHSSPVLSQKQETTSLSKSKTSSNYTKNKLNDGQGEKALSPKVSLPFRRLGIRTSVA